MGVNHLSANGRNVSMGAKLKLATWNCGGLSYTQRELCAQLGYDILALTETHDAGQLRPSKHFLTGDTAPTGDKYAGVAMLLSDRAAGNALSLRGSELPRVICLWYVCTSHTAGDRAHQQQTPCMNWKIS